MKYSVLTWEKRPRDEEKRSKRKRRNIL